MIGVKPQACIYFTEEELTDIMKHIPRDYPQRRKLQQAGKNIFQW